MITSFDFVLSRHSITYSLHVDFADSGTDGAYSTCSLGPIADTRCGLWYGRRLLYMLAWTRRRYTQLYIYRVRVSIYSNYIYRHWVSNSLKLLVEAALWLLSCITKNSISLKFWLKHNQDIALIAFWIVNCIFKRSVGLLYYLFPSVW